MPPAEYGACRACHLQSCEDGRLFHLLQVFLHTGSVCVEHVLDCGLNLQGGDLLREPARAMGAWSA